MREYHILDLPQNKYSMREMKRTHLTTIITSAFIVSLVAEHICQEAQNYIALKWNILELNLWRLI
jgi:hypothetical protein